jgi:hypothetical protein
VVESARVHKAPRNRRETHSAFFYAMGRAGNAVVNIARIVGRAMTHPH